MKNSFIFITRTAVIAALYFVLSVAFAPISFGPVQFRVSEALVLLPILMPEAILGLTLGCFLSNILFSTLFDVLFGTLATLLASILTFVLKKHIVLSAIPPIILNAFLVPIIWVIESTGEVYIINVGTVMLSELIICGIIGIPFTLALKKALYAAHLLKPISSKYNSDPYRYIPKDDVDD